MSSKTRFTSAEITGIDSVVLAVILTGRHKRQHIWNTDWARYTGSVLPMSFAEIDYKHGVDLVSFSEGKKRPTVDFIEYVPLKTLLGINQRKQRERMKFIMDVIRKFG